MDPFLGEIRMFGGNFAPVSWALCNGQLLSISQNSALFSILGTTFGGDGIQTFGLPDLRGRVPLHFGQGPGLSSYQLGQASGSESVSLLVTQMPAHNHALQANSNIGDNPSPIGNLSAVVDDSSGRGLNAYSSTPSGTMSNAAITNAGGSQPHPNMQPYLCVNFIIALQGIYPTRS